MESNELKRPKLSIFFGIMMLLCIAASFAHPVTPTLIVERKLDSSMFGIALAAMMTVNFLVAPFWGKMCGYIPTKKIMLICAIGYSVGQLIFGSAYSEAQIVGGRMFAGFFTGGLFTSAVNYVVNVSDPKERGRNLTIYATIQNVCGAVGYFIGGFLGLVSVDFTFTCQVVLLIACGILFFVFCKDDTAYKHKPDHKLTAADANPFKAFTDAKSFMTPLFAVIFIITAVSGLGQNSFEQVFNYYIKDFFGLSSAYNGIFKAVIAAAGMIANTTLCMHLVKRTDTNITFFPIMIACTIPLGLALFFFNNLIPFAVCDVVFFTFNTVRLPLMQNMAAEKSTPENSNAVMGFYQAMTSLGGIFGAAFAGLIYKTNPHYPFILAFAAFVVSLVFSVKYIRMYKKTKAAK